MTAPEASFPVAASARHGDRRMVRALSTRVVAWLPYAAVALAALVTTMMFWWPLGYDQGVFASNGDVVARGGAPYVDGWDVKGPMVFYATALVQLAFGAHPWSLRLADVLIALGTAALLHARLRTVTSPRVALAAAALWPVVVAAMTWDETIQFDLWTGSAMCWATLAVTRREGARARDLLLAGALVGAATMIKPLFAAFLVIPWAASFARHARLSRALGREWALAAIGAATMSLLVIALLAAQGALREAWNVYIVYNATVYGPYVNHEVRTGWMTGRAMAERLWGLLVWLAEPKTLVLLTPSITGAVALWRRDRVLAAGMLAWTLTAIGLVVLQNKFFPYHWEIVHAALVLLSAVGLHALLTEAKAAGSATLRASGMVLTAAAIGLWSFSPARDLAHWALYVTGVRSAAQYDRSLLSVSEIDPATEAAAAAYLRTHSAPATPFLHWSINGGLAYLAQRPHLVRFHNKRELLRTVENPVTAAYRREVLQAATTRRPSFIVLGEGLGRDARVLPPQRAVATEFPELAALVFRDYELAMRYGDLEIWRRRGAMAGR